MEMDRRQSLTVVPPPIGIPPLDNGDKKNVDGGWAWVILVAMFLSFFTSCGLSYNIGIFFVSFLEAFNESKSYTAWIGAMYSAVFQIAGPISSMLLPYLGARHILLLGGCLMAISYALLFTANSVLYVMIAYGLFGGVGSLFASSGPVAAIVQYFDQRLYVASGIMSAGGGLGITVVGLLVEFLIEKYGWRGAILLLSGLSLQICVCATMVYNNGRQLNKKKRITPHHSTLKTLANGNGATLDQTELLTGEHDAPCRQKYQNSSLKFFKDIRFWFLNGSIMAMNMATAMIIVFCKDILINNGLGSIFKLFLTCIGIGSTMGRGISGFLTNYIDPTLYYFIVGSICAIAVYMFSVIRTEGGVIALAAVFGACHGVMAVLQTIQIAHVFSYDDMPIIWGYGMGLGSFGVLIGPPLGGYIADETGNYDGTIVLVSAIFFTSSFFSLLVFIVRKFQSRNVTTQL